MPGGNAPSTSAAACSESQSAGTVEIMLMCAPQSTDEVSQGTRLTVCCSISSGGHCLEQAGLLCCRGSGSWPGLRGSPAGSLDGQDGQLSPGDRFLLAICFITSMLSHRHCVQARMQDELLLAHSAVGVSGYCWPRAPLHTTCVSPCLFHTGSQNMCFPSGEASADMFLKADTVLSREPGAVCPVSCRRASS